MPGARKYTKPQIDFILRLIQDGQNSAEGICEAYRNQFLDSSFGLKQLRYVKSTYGVHPDFGVPFYSTKKFKDNDSTPPRHGTSVPLDGDQFGAGSSYSRNQTFSGASEPAASSYTFSSIPKRHQEETFAFSGADELRDSKRQRVSHITGATITSWPSGSMELPGIPVSFEHPAQSGPFGECGAGVRFMNLPQQMNIDAPQQPATGDNDANSPCSCEAKIFEPSDFNYDYSAIDANSAPGEQAGGSYNTIFSLDNQFTQDNQLNERSQLFGPADFTNLNSGFPFAGNNNDNNLAPGFGTFDSAQANNPVSAYPDLDSSFDFGTRVRDPQSSTQPATFLAAPDLPFAPYANDHLHGQEFTDPSLEDDTMENTADFTAASGPAEKRARRPRRPRGSRGAGKNKRPDHADAADNDEAATPTQQTSFLDPNIEPAVAPKPEPEPELTVNNVAYEVKIEIPDYRPDFEVTGPTVDTSSYSPFSTARAESFAALRSSKLTPTNLAAVSSQPRPQPQTSPNSFLPPTQSKTGLPSTGHPALPRSSSSSNGTNGPNTYTKPPPGRQCTLGARCPIQGVHRHEYGGGIFFPTLTACTDAMDNAVAKYQEELTANQNLSNELNEIAGPSNGTTRSQLARLADLAATLHTELAASLRIPNAGPSAKTPTHQQPGPPYKLSATPVRTVQDQIDEVEAQLHDVLRQA